MNIYSSPALGNEARRDRAAAREWDRDLRLERARDQFDAKDLFDHLGDDEDRLMALCEALLPLVNANPHRHPLALRGITEALQAITEPEIDRRSA